MNRALIVIILVILAIAGAILLLKSFSKLEQMQLATIQSTPTPSPVEETVSYTARFTIYTNGTLRIFSDPKYHNKSADVYLQADNPSIVYVKKAGVTWSDLFNILPMKLTKDCLTTGTGQNFCTENDAKLRFFINGIEDENALNKEIKSEDKLLVSYGTEAEAQKQLEDN